MRLNNYLPLPKSNAEIHFIPHPSNYVLHTSYCDIWAAKVGVQFSSAIFQCNFRALCTAAAALFLAPPFNIRLV